MAVRHTPAGMVFGAGVLVTAMVSAAVGADGSAGETSAFTEGTSPAASVPAGPATVMQVAGHDFSFEPESLDADPGTTLTIRFENRGLQPHNIAFHLQEGDDPPVSGAIGSILSAGEAEDLTFVVPPPGEYAFVCDVHPLQMRGMLVVRGATASVPASAPATVDGTSTPVASPAGLPLASDPRIDRDAFVVTTFARGLPFPTGMIELPDGSLLVAINPATRGGFVTSTGKLMRLEDTDTDGVADRMTPVGILRTVGRAGVSVYTDLPGSVIQMRRSRDLLFLTSRLRGRTHIIVLREGGTPGDPYRQIGALQLTFPKDHLHDTYALAVRDGSEPGTTEVYFNIGSGLNAEADDARIEATNLVDATLVSGSIYRLTVVDDGERVSATDLRLIATGLRNAAGMAFHPTTGDLYMQDNGMEDVDDPGEPINADELNVIPADRLGVDVPDFGFPDDHIAYRTGVRVGSGAVQPIVAFLPRPGSESVGAAEMVFAPPAFPDAFADGLFVGFHGRYTVAGIANETNPLVFVDLRTRAVFDVVPNDAPDVGHLDSLLATQDALFVADLSRLGDLSTSSPDGVIYRIAVAGTP